MRPQPLPPTEGNRPSGLGRFSISPLGRVEHPSCQPEFLAALQLVQEFVPCDTEIIPQRLTDLHLELFATCEEFDVEDIGSSDLNFNLGIFEVVGTPHL